MRFFFYNSAAFEKWDWRTPDKTGIGASETAQVEMSWRLARRGHEVYSFAPLPAKGATHKGVHWKPVEQATKYLKGPGIWVVSRSPVFLDELDQRSDRKVWFVAQDVEYGDLLSSQRLGKIDRLLALCPVHADYLRTRYPLIRDRIHISSNGARVELMEGASPVERNPYRLIYTSSPDRGLVPLLHIFKRAREFEPRLELVVCYGFQNLLKTAGKQHIKELMDQLEQPGIQHCGRLPQTDLYHLLRSAGMWVYCTDFTETSCASCMEAQCLGAIPVFSPLWALEHNVGHGFAIQGAANDPITRCRFVRAILRLAWFPALAEQMRNEMVGWARRQFDWERVVDGYEMMGREAIRANH